MVPAARCGIWLAIMVLVLLLAAEAGTWIKRRQEIDAVSDEQKIARSLEIIRTSTPSDRKVLKVLFYGQSITLSGWTDAVVEHWRKTYPNTVFVVENRALGGFSSEQLERTTEQDLAAFYPDLIVFHDYGNHHAYERIIRMFRSLTAAEVIVQTDYGSKLPDPPCREGLQWTLHAPAGCAGWLWYHQRDWSDEMSYHKVPAFAAKYGLAVEAQRGWWRDYLLSHHVDPNTLTLPDRIHPNDAGKAILASFFEDYFDGLVRHWNGQREHDVVSIPSTALVKENGEEAFDFDGSRVEMLTTTPVATWPSVAIDGRSPREIDGCYRVTRATSTQSVSGWPATRRITLLGDHTAAEWTATITGISDDENRFDFVVKSSVHGDEGRGDSMHEFIAKSGALKIEPQDWMLNKAYELRHVPTRMPYEVHWSVRYTCGGEPEIIDKGGGKTQYRYTLGTGLANATHTVKLDLPVSDLRDVTEFRIYRPPLK